MKKVENEFSDSRIFRTSGLLLRNSVLKIDNMRTNVQKTYGQSFMNNIRICNELMALSWEADKNDKETKLIYAYVARECFRKAETDLQLIVQAELFPGKSKADKNGSKKVESGCKQFKMGTPELYKDSGDLITQIKGWISSLEIDFNADELETIKKRAQDLLICKYLV